MWRRHACLAAAALALGACKAASLDLGFAVALTIRFDDSVPETTLGSISKLAVDASGDETYAAPVPLDHPVMRVERVIYRPLATTRSLSLQLTASDDLDKPRAVGTIGPLTLVAGHTLEAEVTLSESDPLSDMTASDAIGDGGPPPPDGGGQIVDLDGELVQIPDGWTATVLRDLSTAGFVYHLADFSDANNGDVFDNQPLRVVSLVAPFSDGFAVLAGRTVIELPSSGGSTIHDYTPVPPDQANALDHPSDLHFAQTVGATAGRLLICGGSTGVGDGVFQLSSTWAMSLVANSNNNEAVAFDPSGLFDNKTTAETYYSISAPGALLRVSDGKFIVPSGSSPIDDIEIEPAGAMAVIAKMPNDALQIERVGEVTASAGTYALHTFTSIAVRSMTLTTGAIARLSAAIHVVLPDSLVDLHPDDTTTTLARSLSVGWAWQHATVPPTSHALGAKPSYVILESNRGANRDRLIQLTPP